MQKQGAALDSQFSESFKVTESYTQVSEKARSAPKAHTRCQGRWGNSRGGNDHGSHWLNLFTVEIDLRPSEASPFEAYVGWRHRSGMGGVWDNTYGGSTYEVMGLRYHF